MGLPTSWSLLNIMHLYWWFKASSVVDSHVPKAFSCFGDDAILVAPMPIIVEYNRQIGLCGGELSKGKHALSRTRGLYLEHLMHFTAQLSWVSKEIPVKPHGKWSQSETLKRFGKDHLDSVGCQ